MVHKWHDEYITKNPFEYGPTNMVHFFWEMLAFKCTFLSKSIEHMWINTFTYVNTKHNTHKNTLLVFNRYDDVTTSEMNCANDTTFVFVCEQNQKSNRF